MTCQPFSKLCLTALAVVAAALLIAPPTWADEAKTTFSIPAQDLSPALREFARQSNREILFSSDVALGKTTNGVKGALGADAALIKLLAGTGLVVAKSANGTTLVTTPDAKEASATSGPLIAPSGADKKLDQSGAVNQGSKSLSLEEIVVTGSRIPLTAGQQSVQPVRSYTREDIANSGQSTMGEFLNTLPDVSNSVNPSFGLGIAGVQSVQLHGLPVGTALTLLDGRRMQISSLGFFDVNTIPASAVDRVEILPVGASAIYGADALGGAVNFILRKDFSGFEVNATLDHALAVNDPGITLAWGKAWGRGSISLIASYDHRGELLGSQREPTSGQLPSYATAAQADALLSDACSPGNVYSVDGVSNLPGLSSPYAAIPAGIAGKPTIGQFAQTSGRINTCNFTRYADITPRTQRESALLSAHYELAESADLFTEILLSHRHLQALQGPELNTFSSFGGTVTANSPYNPFGQDVNVAFAFPGAGPKSLQTADLIRPLAGVRGTLFADWHFEATATLSKDRLNFGYTVADPTLVSAALASSDPATALNPFASGPPGSPGLLNSFTDPGILVDHSYEDRLLSAQVILRGPLTQLPAGALQAVIGSEWGQEKHRTTSNAIFGNPASDIDLGRNAYAVFGEGRIPLWATADGPTHRERVTLTIAGRYDHSNDYGGKATWQSGLVWRVTDGLSANASYGQSYQAPRLDQISGPQTTFATPLEFPDPFRGNQPVVYAVNYVSGPNYNLKPETGSSSTLGLQYSSEAIHGLRSSLTWYDLKISNYISAEATQDLVDNPNLFPGAVVRAPATPQDQQQGFLGVITQLNNLIYNFGDLRVGGFDADVSYAVDTPIGQFTPSLAIANIYQWKSALLPGLPAIDSVSKASLSGVGWAPRWKGSVALAWKHGPFFVNIDGRYTGRYLDYQEYVPNTNEIGNTWIVDASARFEVGQEMAVKAPWAEHAYVSVAVVNLANKVPPFSFTPNWYDISEYDGRGRLVRLSVGVRL